MRRHRRAPCRRRPEGRCDAVSPPPRAAHTGRPTRRHWRARHRPEPAPPPATWPRRRRARVLQAGRHPAVARGPRPSVRRPDALGRPRAGPAPFEEHSPGRVPEPGFRPMTAPPSARPSAGRRRPAAPARRARGPAPCRQHARRYERAGCRHAPRHGPRRSLRVCDQSLRAARKPPPIQPLPCRIEGELPAALSFIVGPSRLLRLLSTRSLPWLSTPR